MVSHFQKCITLVCFQISINSDINEQIFWMSTDNFTTLLCRPTPGKASFNGKFPLKDIFYYFWPPLVYDISYSVELCPIVFTMTISIHWHDLFWRLSPVRERWRVEFVVAEVSWVYEPADTVTAWCIQLLIIILRNLFSILLLATRTGIQLTLRQFRSLIYQFQYHYITLSLQGAGTKVVLNKS